MLLALLALAGPAAAGAQPASQSQSVQTTLSPGEAGALLARARRLQGAGFEQKARELVETVAERSTTPIPSQLRAIDQRVGWWRELLGSAGPLVRLILEMLAAALGVCLAGLLCVTGTRALWARIERSVQLEGFEGSSEATLGAVLSAALSQALTRMSNERAGRRVNWQSGTEPKFELPSAIGEAVPAAGILAGLIEMLDRMLYRRVYSVAGTVHPVHEHRGAGLTLAISRRSGRTVEQVTIWERDFLLKEAGDGAPIAVRYERLVLPAAVWLGYSKTLGAKEGKRPLQTRDWRSYALFALGEIVPDDAKERRLYELALDLDQGNLGARLNLAALLLKRPAYEVPPKTGGGGVANGSREGWRECLDTAEDHLNVVAGRTDPRRDAIWYRARYLQAVVSVYRGTRPFCTNGVAHPCDPCRRAGLNARARLDELQREISVHGRETALASLLDALEQPIDVLRKTAALIAGDPFGLPGASDPTWRSATAEYNLACLLSRYADRIAADAGRDAAAKRAALVEAVRRLRRALARDVLMTDGALLAEARVDPAFDGVVRRSKAFKTLTAIVEPPSKPGKPTRYAVTLDPGPEMVKLVSG